MHRANTEQSSSCKPGLLSSPAFFVICVDYLDLIVIKANWW